MSPTPFRLLLLRHGQTHGNVAGALDTAEPGLDLTELGRTQAAAAATALAGEPIEAIYVSRLARTHQTAAPFAERLGLDPVQLDGLHEVGAGEWEMGTDHDAVTGYITTVAAWIDGDLDQRIPGGETGHEFRARFDASIRELAAAGHTCALVVSHGAAIRTWVSLQVDEHDVPGAHQHLHNTACLTLEGHPDTGWKLVSWVGDPVGGELLEDPSAPDPTGEPDAD